MNSQLTLPAGHVAAEKRVTDLSHVDRNLYRYPRIKEKLNRTLGSACGGNYNVVLESALNLLGTVIFEPMEVDGKSQSAEEPFHVRPTVVQGSSCEPKGLRCMINDVPKDFPAENSRPVKVWDMQIITRRHCRCKPTLFLRKNFSENFPRKPVKRLGVKNFGSSKKIQSSVLETILEEAMQTLAHDSKATDDSKPFRYFTVRESERNMEEVEKLMWNLDLKKKNQNA